MKNSAIMCIMSVVRTPAGICMKFVYAVFAFSQGDVVVTIMASDGDKGINDAVTYAFNSSKL